MIRVVSFDIDDTLYDFQTASRHAVGFVVKRIRQALGPDADGIDAEELIADLIAQAASMANPCVDLPDLRRRSFLRTLRKYGSEDLALAAELNHVYLEHRFETVRPFDDARATLARLAEDYTLCAVSNGEQDLGQLGLDDLFRFTTLPRDAGVDKPDPRIFLVAMARAGCEANEFVHVGDSETSDVMGAKAAGAYAVWFNPAKRPALPEAKADAEVARLAELAGVIKALDGSSVKNESRLRRDTRTG